MLSVSFARRKGSLFVSVVIGEEAAMIDAIMIDSPIR